jgi:hypothetical protein
MIRLFLTLILINSPIKEDRQIRSVANTMKSYAAVVGVDLRVHIKSIKNRSCEGFADWSSIQGYHACIAKQYGGRDKLRPSRRKNTLFHFVRAPFNYFGSTILGGIASVCSGKQLQQSPVGISAFIESRSLPSEIVASHEILHQLGALHNYTPDNIMLPNLSDKRIRELGGLNVVRQTVKEVEGCLK